MKINLAPEIQEEKNRIKKTNSYAILGSAGFILVIVGAIAILTTIYFAQKIQSSTLDKKIDRTKTEISKYKELEEIVVSLQKGLEGAKKALNQDNNIANLFNHLEYAMPIDTKLDSIKIDVQTSIVESDIKAKNIEALGKLEESLKNYKILFILGADTPGKKVKITTPNTQAEVITKPNGTWSYPAKIDPSADLKITIQSDENSNSEISYTAVTKTIASSGKTVATITSPFSTPQIESYEKEEDGTIGFKLNLGFLKELLW